MTKETFASILFSLWVAAVVIQIGAEYVAYRRVRHLSNRCVRSSWRYR